MRTLIYRWLLENVLAGMKIYDPARTYTTHYAGRTVLLALNYRLGSTDMELSFTGDVKTALDAVNKVVLELRGEAR